MVVAALLCLKILNTSSIDVQIVEIFEQTLIYWNAIHHDIRGGRSVR